MGALPLGGVLGGCFAAIRRYAGFFCGKFLVFSFAEISFLRLGILIALVSFSSYFVFVRYIRDSSVGLVLSLWAISYQFFLQGTWLQRKILSIGPPKFTQLHTPAMRERLDILLIYP